MGVNLMNIAPMKQFSKTDDPISIERPLEKPLTEPVIVHVLNDAKFGHAQPPVETEVALPPGKWEKVILTITGKQEGRQFDRLMHILAGNTQIFAGCTPEPSKGGIDWKIEKDITIYLPVLSGTQQFTTILDNYMDELHTGIPEMSFYLEFYPAMEGEEIQKQWVLHAPDAIIPILSKPAPYVIEKEDKMDVPLLLPNDLKEIYLDLYIIHQNRDEFYWSLHPSFREVEIYIDDIPAGVVWPEPILFTGGVNPLLWRPVTGIRSMNLPSYQLNLTPFAGLLGGEHTLSIKVANNANYWLASGSLFLYQNNGKPTKGKIINNTLQLPSKSHTEKTSVLDTVENNFVTEEAKMSYRIEGEVETEEGVFTSTIDSQLQFSNDQMNDSSIDGLRVHGAQVVITDEILSKAGQTIKTQHRQSTYTLDCFAAYMRGNEVKGLSMPSNVSQTFTEVFRYDSPELTSPYQSTLYLNSQGYAVLQRMDEHPDVTHANTTGHIHFQDSLNNSYQNTIMTRGGVVYYNYESGN